MQEKNNVTKDCVAGVWCVNCKHCKIIDNDYLFEQISQFLPEEKSYELRYKYTSSKGTYFGKGYICNKYLKENICTELEENS